jgi:hypothetical protein
MDEGASEIAQPVSPDTTAEPLHAEREAVLEERRNDWRARFRAALHRNK